jgi:hypothetical protein
MRRYLAVLVVGALFTGACNSDGGADPSENPKEALTQAFEAVGDEPTTITISLDADEEALEGTLQDSPDPPPPGTAATILDSAFVFSANGEAGENARAEFSFVIGGEPMVEATVEQYDLYLRADVPGLLETFQVDPARLDKQLAQVPPGLEFVRDAAAGEWIHLTGLEQLAGMAGQQQGSEEQQEEAVRFFEGVIDEHVTASEGDEEGPGTHVQAELALKDAFEEFMSFAQESAGGTFPGGLPPTQDIPEGELLVDTWIDDGRLTQLRVDLIENSDRFGGDRPPQGLDEFALLVELEEWDEETEVPDDAVEVSFEDIFGALMGGAFATPGSEGAGGGTTGSPEDVCKQIAVLPKEQQEPFKDICPDL